MDSKQQQMVDFETSWYALGGGASSQITERFGLTDHEFFAQVDELVKSSPPDTLSRSQLGHMREVIRSRLWMAG